MIPAVNRLPTWSRAYATCTLVTSVYVWLGLEYASGLYPYVPMTAWATLWGQAGLVLMALLLGGVWPAFWGVLLWNLLRHGT